MKIRIASRKSDLARLQAYRVAEAIKEKNPTVSIEFIFRESLGDKNLETPLWKIPTKGVFTEDFLNDLQNGSVDLVVHSWKDLPTEARENICIMATLPRADARDIFFLRKSSLGQKKIKVLTSSPRRIYSIQKFLGDLLPFPTHFETETVRGNIPTRLQKLLRGDGDALLMAKAALDRLLSAHEPEFADVKQIIYSALKELHWMVLPLSYFPTAPAQGAIAIEGRKDREDLRKILQTIHCSETQKTVETERHRFAAYGGGCHQKIGLTVQSHSHFGEIQYFSGELDSGEQQHSIQVNSKYPAPSKNRWPLEPTSLFERIPSETLNPKQNLYLARAEALPKEWHIQDQLIWCAGLDSWKKLSQRGVWVNGCSDGLGEEIPRTEHLDIFKKSWIKLSHDKTKNKGTMPILATYSLKNKNIKIPEEIEECFWMSETAFYQALSLQPKLMFARHAAGPGYTAKALEKYLGKPIEVYLNYKHWKTGNPI